MPPLLNPFVRARQEERRGRETEAKWFKEMAWRGQRLADWVETCPADLLTPENRAKVLEYARERLTEPSGPGWEWEGRSLSSAQDVIGRFERQWLDDIDYPLLPVPYPLGQRLVRLASLIQTLCRESLRKPKSKIREAVYLARKLGHSALAQEVIPHIQTWRREFLEKERE